MYNAQSSFGEGWVNFCRREKLWRSAAAVSLYNQPCRKIGKIDCRRFDKLVVVMETIKKNNAPRRGTWLHTMELSNHNKPRRDAPSTSLAWKKRGSAGANNLEVAAILTL